MMTFATFPRLRLPVVLVLLVGTWAVVHADTRSAHRPQAEFSQHYDSGMRHYEQKEYSAAITELQAAFQLEQKPKLLYNLARAHFELGHADEALSLYQRFLTLEPSPPPEVRKRAEDEMNRARQMIRVADRLRADEEERSRQERQPPSPSAPPLQVEAASGVLPRADPPSAHAEKSPPLYKRWWLWTAVGVVVAGVVTGATLGYQATHPSLPERRYMPVF